MQAGQQVTFTPTTPGIGPNEPSNDLDLALKLYDANDALVATSLTGALVFTPAQSGTYRLAVERESGEGDYVIAIAGAVTPAAALSVVGTTPVEDALLNTYPSQYQVHFSREVDFRTVSASDLTVNGVAASAVRMMP